MRCVIGGDGLSLSIAAASIVAKVLRDRTMIRLAARYPGYDWQHQCRLRHAGALGRFAGPRPDPAPPVMSLDGVQMKNQYQDTKLLKKQLWIWKKD